MNIKRNNERTLTFPYLSRKLSVVFVWAIVVYSLIIQSKYFTVNNGILILGILMLAAFLFAQGDKGIAFNRIFTTESMWMLAFMIYMLPVGFIFAPSSGSHMAQWVTSFEYLIMMIVISSLIMNSGMEAFHLLILTVAIILLILLLQSPVIYRGTDRYTIAADVNPNGLGMIFTLGIWALLYYQQKKIPLVIALGIIAGLFYGIILTGSRKALIAAGIIMLFWFFLCFLPNVKNGNSQWKPVVLISSILLIVLLGMLFFKLYSGSDMASRMGNLESETASGNRTDMYINGWKLFLDNPLFGFGFQGFRYYNGYYSHATLVEVPVSSGIVGCILYYASYCVSISKVFSIFRFCKNNKEFTEEYRTTKMLLVMWAPMLFYCTCVIHPYQLDSYVVFGIIFGQTAYINNKITVYLEGKNDIKVGKCKWIRQ